MFLAKYKTPRMVEKSDSLNNIDPNYEFVDVIDAIKHDNITSIENIANLGLLTGRDFIFVRDELYSQLVLKGGWDSVSMPEKHCICRYVLCTESQALTIISKEQLDLYDSSVLDNTKLARANRVELARKDLGKERLRGTLAYADSRSLNLDTDKLFETYIVSDNKDFSDWIKSEGAYVGNGFLEKPYGNADRKQKLIDKIINGKI